jgi:hypothetical protein
MCCPYEFEPFPINPPQFSAMDAAHLVAKRGKTWREISVNFACKYRVHLNESGKHSWNDLRFNARNREGWRRFVDNLCSQWKYWHYYYYHHRVHTSRVLWHAVKSYDVEPTALLPPLKEVVLHILSPLKSIALGWVWIRKPLVQWQAQYPLHHWQWLMDICCKAVLSSSQHRIKQKCLFIDITKAYKILLQLAFVSNETYFRPNKDANQTYTLNLPN